MTEAEWIAFLQRPEIPAFNRAMLANPDDDLPRLVFADWMDENCPDTDVNRAVRRSVTHPAEREQWVSVQPLGIALSLVRGRNRISLLDEAQPAAAVMSLWRKMWVGAIAFGNVKHNTALRWIQDTGMESVESVEFLFCESGEQLAALLSSRRLRSLKSLELECGRNGAEMIRVLGESEVLPQLTALSLGGFGFQGESLRALWRSRRVRGLKALSLRWSSITAETFESLATSPNLRGLVQLTFTGTQVGLNDAATLANSPYLCEAIRAQWRCAPDGGGANR